MSLGGLASRSLDDAVSNSIAAGVAYAIAAGNNSLACFYSPAATPTAMTVGATDATDTRASFSNYGTCLDFFAPGQNITSGAAVSEIVLLEVSASDDRGMAQVEFFVDGSLVGTSSSAPYTASWNSRSVPNGSHTLTTKAYDTAGNAATSAAVTVNVRQPGSASYDPALNVPACSQPSHLCDTTALLMGRAASELHSPNTLDGCMDGTGQDSSRREQIQWLRVSREDGTLFAAGKRVHVDVEVISSSSYYDELDLYSASDASNPTWTYLTTIPANGDGRQVLSAEYILPAGSLQAVRASFRYNGSGPSPAAPAFMTTTMTWSSRWGRSRTPSNPRWHSPPPQAVPRSRVRGR